MTESATRTVLPSAMRRPPRWRRMLRRGWRGVVAALAVVGFITIVRPFVFDLTPIISASMSPALQGDARRGDWILAEKLTYLLRTPRRWEVVEFYDQDGLKIMKRVAALPGESIAIQDHRIQINGQFVPPPEGAAPVKYFAYGSLAGGRSHAVEAGYFVLGDASADSQDSRYDGAVAMNRIRARAWLIVWPPSRVGWVR